MEEVKQGEYHISPMALYLWMEDCFDRTLIRLIELLFTDFIDTDGMENDGVMEERFD